MPAVSRANGGLRCPDNLPLSRLATHQAISASRILSSSLLAVETASTRGWAQCTCHGFCRAGCPGRQNHKSYTVGSRGLSEYSSIWAYGLCRMRCILQSQVLHGLQGSIFVSPQRARVSDVVSPSYLVGGGGGGARGLWQKGGGVISRRWLLLCSWLAVSCASDLVERLRALALAEGKSPSPHMPSDGDRRCYKHNAYVSIACVCIYIHTIRMQSTTSFSSSYVNCHIGSRSL